MVNKQVLFDEYSLKYSVDTICSIFPDMRASDLLLKFGPAIKPKINAFRFSTLS